MGAFELFMCCLGNGVTVCNKAVKEHNDYKMIAHIREYGHIKWYVIPSTYVPNTELQKIINVAKKQREDWEEWFNSHNKYWQYEYLLDRVSFKVFVEVVAAQKTLEEKIKILKNIYTNN